jgi:septal ring-binding cell division protein DamX
MKLFTLVLLLCFSTRSIAQEKTPATAAGASVPASSAPVVSAPAENGAAPATAASPTANAPAEAAAPNAPQEKVIPSADEGGYEIDYEEEPDAENAEPEEAPARTKKSKKILTNNPTNSGAGGVQGSIAKNRFVPILKSETKSVYKKDGNSLDVDTD